MSSVIEAVMYEQPVAEFEQPGVTGVFAAPALKPEAPEDRDLQEEIAALVEMPYRDARKEAVAVFERIYIRALLARCGGNVSLSARVAGVDRVYLHRLIRRHGLRAAKKPADAPLTTPT